mmetsp:Transcript_8209/g.26223  ORF Transcript_8209/g.26223 Transcript_8209/m.26223 type:complete len:205 (-) Transcript_8209:169-783(-)
MVQQRPRRRRRERPRLPRQVRRQATPRVPTLPRQRTRRLTTFCPRRRRRHPPHPSLELVNVVGVLQCCPKGWKRSPSQTRRSFATKSLWLTLAWLAPLDTAPSTFGSTASTWSSPGPLTRQKTSSTLTMCGTCWLSRSCRGSRHQPTSATRFAASATPRSPYAPSRRTRPSPPFGPPSLNLTGNHLPPPSKGQTDLQVDHPFVP